MPRYAQLVMGPAGSGKVLGLRYWAIIEVPWITHGSGIAGCSVCVCSCSTLHFFQTRDSEQCKNGIQHTCKLMSLLELICNLVE